MSTSYPSTQSVYRVQSLVKRYQAREVLGIEDLTIYRGEILALVGPSGAGKSTLLRLLNFLEPPSQGRIEFAGYTFTSDTEMPLEVRRKGHHRLSKPPVIKKDSVGQCDLWAAAARFERP